LLYIHSETYNAELTGRLRFDDPKINISWPLEVTTISNADRRAPMVSDEYKGMVV
jgi:dTDP-4-dehydrorhamnose 3,5-epimerase